MEMVMFLVLFFVNLSVTFGGKYQYFQTAVSWHEAQDRCESQGTFLARVDEMIEHVRIQRMKQFINMEFWIGLRLANSNYQWTDTTTAVFTAWGQDQPNSQSQCVKYRPSDMMWETYNCSASLFFLCENGAASNGKAITSQVAVTGLSMGFGVMFGVMLLIVALLQMPCCRTNSMVALSSFGVGRRDW
ncbi:macrophage mannose receptor 1-like [Pomacea canaliculata]|uniref:macrophage mannose receptor 1-like n=1 Tax=Pomacea canaliculata TaxID=400727 RepID=UPI000D725547|nr:macrophage mannose receptor 1-like [Pomacea canaliculata]